MKKTIIILLNIFFLSTSLFSQPKPNILLIIADDMGNDAIEGFGIESANFPTTPNLDDLKSTGISYMNTWATPQCTPTRASIMSGKYGVNTGVTRAPGNLDLEHESIFNFINSETNNPYSTAVIGKWHISQPSNIDHPFEHGADHYEGVIDGTIEDYYDWEKVENGQFIQVEEYVTTHLTNAAIDWVSNQDSPWFLWLSHIAPHAPYQVPPDGLYTIENPTSNKQIYNASIEALDHEIGRLLASMDEETRNNTLVIFLGDNGTPNGVLSQYPAQHGKASMYEGGIRVPMIISGSGVTRNGAQEFGLTQVNDLYSTLFDVGTNNNNSLPGGIYNSYSIEASFQNQNAILRDYVYSDYTDDGVQFWAIRKGDYKLIQNENGDQELYNLSQNPFEEDNLIGNLTSEEEVILADLEEEAAIIRSGWSCQDLILNGSEVEIDDCDTGGTDCPEVDILSDENIGCCDSPDEPSVYHEYEENDLRHIYSNGFPDHDYCYNPANPPSQSYHYFRIDKDPQFANETTSIVRENGRPARHFGVALNGVFLSPAPGPPFIYTNKNTGEFNWDWVFEPTNNQGDGEEQVQLDCATAHTNASGYHYHGEMYQYLETDFPGITTTTSLSELYQVGWASDGFPIIYKFGPDINGEIRELMPSFQLKSGERPGDGIVAPCGPYTGKYTVDYEYIEGFGDLDECNGIESQITLETALGLETFDYFYVVTSSFPQIGRCLRGTTSQDFENSEDPITGVDMDGDGYLSQFECDDTNPNINPSAVDIPDNGIDEDCDGMDATNIVDADNDGFDNTVDCDDSNPDVNPDQTEVTYNGLDDDCDPETLDDDLDQDGFLLIDDCDDNNADVNPDQAEETYNALDDDCDPETLDDDLDQDGFLLIDDCDDNNADVNPDQAEETYNGLDDDCDPETLDDDLDQDGFLLIDDCDDNNADVNPDAEEIANNGIDEDCDGLDLVTSTFEISNTTINIYPNPTTDIINIHVEGQLNFEVRIYDLRGILVTTALNTSIISVNSFTSGIYLLEIRDINTGQKIIKRIVIGN